MNKKMIVLYLLIVLVTARCCSIAIASENDAFEVSLIKTQQLTASQWVNKEENRSYFTALAYVECILHCAEQNEATDKFQSALLSIVEYNKPISISYKNDSVFAVYRIRANEQLLIEYNPQTKEMIYTFERKDMTTLDNAIDVQLEDYLEKLNSVFGMFGISLY